MTHPYLFQSDRLGFRNWTSDDLAEFALLNADAKVMEHFPKPLTKQETADSIKRYQTHYEKYQYTYFATDLLESGEFIGLIGLMHQTYEAPFSPATDIGWRLKRTAWGKGLATEGAKKCLQFAFAEAILARVVSVCPIVNAKSESVMTKIGMTKKGEFLHPALAQYPALERCAWYEITRDEIPK
ncbi:MAG: GNAT family N-acetyltransferase [Bacteroidota bacterium]